MKAREQWGLLALLLAAALPSSAAAQTAFTYQGRLNDNGAPATGQYDLRFTLHNAASAGSQIGSPATLAPVSVVNGVFTVTLDFGQNAFPGAGRWLEVGVRDNGSADPYATITPRQPITRAPYAIHATSADTVIAGGIGSDEIENGAISAADIDATSVGLWGVNGGNVHRATGRVGVGTTSPSQALHVVGSALFQLNAVNAAVEWVEIAKPGGEAGLIFYNAEAERGELQFTADGFLVNLTETGHDMIVSGGNIGIGSASPDAPLHSRSGALNIFDANSPTVGAGLRLRSSTGGERAVLAFAGADNQHSASAADNDVVLRAEVGDLHLQSGLATGAAALTISGGNVGIGMGNPTTALHVKAPGVPTVIDSSNGNTYKIQFSDNGFTRGFIGARTTVAFEIANSAASRLLTVADDGDVGCERRSKSAVPGGRKVRRLVEV